MITLVNQLKQTTQLKWNRISTFKTKVPIYLEFNSYIIKTADSQEELLESFKLRHEVFHREFRGLNNYGIDIDRFDSRFDHLVIIYKPTNEIIGTYRLNCSTFSSSSYTSQEFYLDELLELDGPFLELGRACVLKAHRKGSVLSLLWRGIAHYMNECEAKVLFGCTSLKIKDPEEAALVYAYLIESGMVDDSYNCTPQSGYRMDGFFECFEKLSIPLSAEQKNQAEELLPSLLQSYIKMGAKIASAPAYDAEFQCIDLLTVLHKENMPMSLAQKFNVAR